MNNSNKIDDAFEILESIAKEISNEEYKNIVLTRINNCSTVLMLALRADGDERGTN